MNMKTSTIRSYLNTIYCHPHLIYHIYIKLTKKLDLLNIRLVKNYLSH